LSWKRPLASKLWESSPGSPLTPPLCMDEGGRKHAVNTLNTMRIRIVGMTYLHV